MYNLPTDVECGTLPDPTNGQVSLTGTNFDSEANYVCDNGYVLTGSSLRVCQADGEWSSAEPLCERKLSYICK